MFPIFSTSKLVCTGVTKEENICKAADKVSESHKQRIGCYLSEDVSKLFFVDGETLKKVAALFGEDAVRVVEVLKGAHAIIDMDIVDQTEIRLNTVRKTLYRLYDHSLVALRRSRDEETGWFVFHWRLQPDQLEGFHL